LAETAPDDVKAMSFEAALAELESIVSRLEGGKAPLAESIAIYERGEALKSHCEGLLKAAEARIEKITLKNGVHRLRLEITGPVFDREVSVVMRQGNMKPRLVAVSGEILFTEKAWADWSETEKKQQEAITEELRRPRWQQWEAAWIDEALRIVRDQWTRYYKLPAEEPSNQRVSRALL